MKLNQDLEKFKDYIIIVEGKKDVRAMKDLGFKKIYPLHKISISLRERVEEICSNIKKEDLVCILTDSDKQGKKYHATIKKILQEHGIKIDSSLRKIIMSEGLSHIEGLETFVKKLKTF